MSREDAQIQAEILVGLRVMVMAEPDPEMSRTDFSYQVQYLGTKKDGTRYITHVRPGTVIEYALFSALVNTLGES